MTTKKRTLEDSGIPEQFTGVYRLLWDGVGFLLEPLDISVHSEIRLERLRNKVFR